MPKNYNYYNADKCINALMTFINAIVAEFVASLVIVVLLCFDTIFHLLINFSMHACMLKTCDFSLY